MRPKLQVKRINFIESPNSRIRFILVNVVKLLDLIRRIPDEYEISGQRKGFKSFRTAYTLKLNKDLEEAESRRDAAQVRFFFNFVYFNVAEEYFHCWDMKIGLSSN